MESPPLFQRGGTKRVLFHLGRYTFTFTRLTKHEKIKNKTNQLKRYALLSGVDIMSALQKALRRIVINDLKTVPGGNLLVFSKIFDKNRKIT